MSDYSLTLIAVPESQKSDICLHCLLGHYRHSANVAERRLTPKKVRIHINWSLEIDPTEPKGLDAYPFYPTFDMLPQFYCPQHDGDTPLSLRKVRQSVLQPMF